MTTRRTSRTLCLIGALCASGALSACHYEGGAYYSDDKYTYVSRTWSPWTVSVIDTRSGDTVWTIDLPVGQKLSLGFREGSGPNQDYPDMMDWGTWPSDQHAGQRRNQVPMPPSHARRLDPVLRPVPESPPAAQASGG